MWKRGGGQDTSAAAAEQTCYFLDTSRAQPKQVEPNNRDFSRFSEDWPGSVVVGFGSVTVSLTKLLVFGALAGVCRTCPRLLYSVRGRSV